MISLLSASYRVLSYSTLLVIETNIKFKTSNSVVYLKRTSYFTLLTCQHVTQDRLYLRAYQ